MFCIQTSKVYNNSSYIYLNSYLLLLVLSIIKFSNVIYILHISSIYNLIFNIIIFVILLINIYLLFVYNSLSKCIIPSVLTLLFVILLFYHIKIVPLGFLLIYLSCYNSKLLNLNKFVKYSLLSTVIAFIIIILLYLMNIIPNVVSVSAGIYKGNSLGFFHPNGTGTIVISIISFFMMMFDYNNLIHRSNTHNFIRIFIIDFILTTLFFYITDCRELLYFGIITLFLLLFLNFSLIKRFIYILLIPMVLIIPSLSIYLDYNLNLSNSFYLYINKWLSNRIVLQNQIIYDYPVTFLRKAKDIPTNHSLLNKVILDNSFLSILESCGIIGLIIVGIFIIKVILMGIKNDEYIPCIILLALIICSCVVTSLFTVFFEGPCLYLTALYHKRYLHKGDL